MNLAERVKRAWTRRERPVGWITKEAAPCCNSRRDEDGRLPIGWCSPECVRRPGGGDAA